MKPEVIFFIIVGGFLCGLIFYLIVFYKPLVPAEISQYLSQLNTKNGSTVTDEINNLKKQIKSLETNTNQLIKWQDDQKNINQDFQKFISTHSAEIVSKTSNKSILAEAHTQGSLFTTTSAAYSPMGMYVNIKCPKNCYLWINFYTSAKNLGPVSSALGNYNTFNLFLDNIDKSIYSQASYAAANAAVPVALNTVISAGAGLHTIDIRAKTSGGTLQSDTSALQVIAIER